MAAFLCADCIDFLQCECIKMHGNVVHPLLLVKT